MSPREKMFSNVPLPSIELPSRCQSSVPFSCATVPMTEPARQELLPSAGSNPAGALSPSVRSATTLCSSRLSADSFRPVERRSSHPKQAAFVVNIFERMGEPRRAWLMMEMRCGGCRRVDSAQSEASREDVYMGAFERTVLRWRRLLVRGSGGQVCVVTASRSTCWPVTVAMISKSLSRCRTVSAAVSAVAAMRRSGIEGARCWSRSARAS